MRERDEEEDELNEEREREIACLISEQQRTLFGQFGWKAEICLMKLTGLPDNIIRSGGLH